MSVVRRGVLVRGPSLTGFMDEPVLQPINIEQLVRLSFCLLGLVAGKQPFRSSKITTYACIGTLIAYSLVSVDGASLRTISLHPSKGNLHAVTTTSTNCLTLHSSTMTGVDVTVQGKHTERSPGSGSIKLLERVQVMK